MTNDILPISTGARLTNDYGLQYAVASGGHYSAATAQNASAKYQEQVADGQAQQANALGTINARQHDLQVRALIGEQEAGYAGGGVEVNSGSALTQTVQTAGFGAVDSLAIKQQAANSATALQNQASLDASKEVNPLGVAGTSLLTSSSSIGNSLFGANKAGLFSYFMRAGNADKLPKADVISERTNARAAS